MSAARDVAETMAVIEVSNKAIERVTADMPLERVEAILADSRSQKEHVEAVNRLLAGDDVDVSAISDADLEREWGAAAAPAVVPAAAAVSAPAPAIAVAARAPVSVPAAAAPEEERRVAVSA